MVLGGESMAEARKTGRNVEYEKPKTPVKPPVPPKKKTVKQIKTISYPLLNIDYFDNDVNAALADGWDFYKQVEMVDLKLVAILEKEVDA